MTILQLLAGLLFLVVAGEALVKGSVAVAQKLGVSPLLIGLTLVGFGTSTPELVASLQAALMGSPGIAVGNVVGSNIANILLILGISAIILPIATTKEAFRRDGTVLIVASLVLLLTALAGQLERWMGIVFLVLLLAYTLLSYFTERDTGAPSADVHRAEAQEVMDMPPKTMGLGVGIAVALAGIAGVVLGADLLVGAAIVIARDLGLSEAVIGLTLVAVGTSLPELVTSVMAALRKHSDVAFGNIVGSNIFNIFGIAGITATVVPIEVPAQIVVFDIWAMMAAAVLLVIFATTGWRISRREGAIFLLLYIGYLVLQLSPTVREAVGLA